MGIAGIFGGWSRKSASNRARTISILRSNNSAAGVGNYIIYDDIKIPKIDLIFNELKKRYRIRYQIEKINQKMNKNFISRKIEKNKNSRKIINLEIHQKNPGI